MSLPARQQRMLAGIEGALQTSEPRMTAMFAVFTQLTRDEGPAMPEQLERSRLDRLGMAVGLRAFVLLPVVLVVLIAGVALGGTARGVNLCSSARATAAVVLAARQPAISSSCYK
jgi:hypothetical protein